MPAPVCSVLIPSRARPDRLLKAIRSVWSTAAPAPRSDIEVLVRLDTDDTTAITPDPATGRTLIDTLEAEGVRVLVGERGRGYNEHVSFYVELSAIATAPWIWIMNDDAHVARTLDIVPPTDPIYRQRRTRWDAAWVLGKTWLEQLRHMPATGVIVQAEMYKLGGSAYFDSEGSAFPIVPRDAWKHVGVTHPEGPLDAWLDRVLRTNNGWRTKFLVGVATVHERDTDAELAIHRQL